MRMWDDRVDPGAARPPARTYTPLPTRSIPLPASVRASSTKLKFQLPRRERFRESEALTRALFFKSRFVLSYGHRIENKPRAVESRPRSPREEPVPLCMCVGGHGAGHGGRWGWLRQRVPEGLIARWRGAPGATLRVDISARWCRLSHRPRSSFHRHTQVIATAPQGLSKSSL